MNKILLVGLTPPQEGGSEMHIHEISKRIKDGQVLTQSSSFCKNKIGIPIFGKKQLIQNLAFFFFASLYLSYLLIKPRKSFDVIHIHENTLYWMIPFLKLRFKVVTTVHGIKGFKFYDNKKLWLIFSFFLKFSDTLIVVNMEDKKNLDKYFKSVVYVPNGVDLEPYKVKVKLKEKISFIGRIHEQKGIIYLLDAFNSLSNEFPKLKLEIIGKINEYAKDLQRKYKNKNIIWKGFMSDRKEIAKFLKSSICIALPSLWEGLPLVLFESLASSRPVIVSDIPAYKSVLKDEAIFCKSKNSEDLKNKIIFILKNKKSADSLGKRGEKLSKKYSWDTISNQIFNLYNSL